MKTIPIAEATEAQLRAFASDTLGLSISPSVKFETVLARVKTAWDKPDITVSEAEPETAQEAEDRSVPQAPQAATQAQRAPKEGMVRVIVNIQEEAGGADPIQVGVNGKIMLIPRGKEVDIPEAYFEVLTHAILHKYEAMPDGGMNPIPRKVPIYPFQRVA